MPGLLAILFGVIKTFAMFAWEYIIPGIITEYIVKKFRRKKDAV